MSAAPHVLPTSVDRSEAPRGRRGAAPAGAPCDARRQPDDLFRASHPALEGSGCDIHTHPLAGGFKRVVSGMPIFMTEARGPGSIAFSRDGVGQISSLHLQPGEASSSGSTSSSRPRTISSSPTTASRVEHVLRIERLLRRPLREREPRRGGALASRLRQRDREGARAGRADDVEPGGSVFRDQTRAGRVAIQSMYIHWPTAA